MPRCTAGRTHAAGLGKTGRRSSVDVSVDVHPTAPGETGGSSCVWTITSSPFADQGMTLRAWHPGFQPQVAGRRSPGEPALLVESPGTRAGALRSLGTEALFVFGVVEVWAFHSVAP